MTRLRGTAKPPDQPLSRSTEMQHAEIKGNTIRIGVLTDMSGLFATAMGPGSVEAARMAADEFGGKINGKPIDDGRPGGTRGAQSRTNF
jgi:branched-chain amino acid transport system substrate-binding protein